jgi:hypothetical protein
MADVQDSRWYTALTKLHNETDDYWEFVTNSIDPTEIKKEKIVFITSARIPGVLKAVSFRLRQSDGVQCERIWSVANPLVQAFCQHMIFISTMLYIDSEYISKDVQFLGLQYARNNSRFWN